MSKSPLGELLSHPSTSWENGALLNFWGMGVWTISSQEGGGICFPPFKKQELILPGFEFLGTDLCILVLENIRSSLVTQPQSPPGPAFCSLSGEPVARNPANRAQKPGTSGCARRLQ